ncbi:hypothetical protein FRC12_024768 [Ceratobasidium sp. 428]|nr:hypothetical protein FRC12_024768 [Ceratobasidium sp. 428]
MQTKPSEERLDPHTVEELGTGQRADLLTGEQGKNDLDSGFSEAPRLGYDDYGKELGKNARVWKTYVQEASRWDADMVDGWNRFVIESLKSLQPDPAVASSNTLSAISQTLFLIANSQPGSPLSLTAPEPETFVAPVSAICVNALWFLSLSLSVSVSLIAMLAKDWARGYVAELTGQPYQQARKRQRRWDGLKEWRVPEVITFLPSLLHLALFGLTVYLWSIHLGAAVPVLVVTGMSVVAYGVSTVLPLLDEHCPYNTPLSKLIKVFPRPQFVHHLKRWLSSAEPEELMPQLEWPFGQVVEEDLMDDLTSRALAWLIVNYEDTKSADIALQAIAGASAKLPMLPLARCNAHELLFERMESCFVTRQSTGKTYLKDRALLEAASLYHRALTNPASFQPEVNDWGSTREPWEIFFSTITPSLHCLVDNGTISATSDPNKAAFSLAATSIAGHPYVLKPNPYIVLTDRLLQLHLKGEIALEAPALLALLRATTHWSKFEAVDENLADHVRLMITAVQFANSSDAALYPTLQVLGLLGAALTAFACSRRSYHSWPLSESSHQESRRSEANSITKYYEHSLSSAAVDSLLTFGLLELLKNHADILRGGDFINIFNAFRNHHSRPTSINIHALPVQIFGSNYRYLVETAMSLLKPNSQGAYAWSEGARAACLAVFDYESCLESLPQAVDIYALALENLRSASLSLLKQSCCLLLAIGNNRNLIDGLLRRNVLPSYLEMLECEDERVVPYVMTGVASIIRFATGSESNQSLSNRLAILSPVLSFDQFLNVAQRTNQGQSSRLTMDNLKTACAIAWLPHLEDMIDRIPKHIFASGILHALDLSPQGRDYYPLWDDQYQALWERISQIPNKYDPPDWS